MTDINNENCSEDVTFLKYQLSVARSEISNLRQQLKSLKHTYRKDCDEIRQQLQNWRCLDCSDKQFDGTNSTSSPDLSLNYIGSISTHFPEKRGTPRQPGICSSTIAKLTLNNSIFTNPEHALEGLQEYSHLCGVDMVDQTPVLDIKPYIPQYDNPSIPFNENLGISAYASDLSNSLVDISSLNSLSLNDCNLQELGDNLNVRVMDGEENGERAQSIIGASTANGVNSNLTSGDTSYHETRSVSRIGEREAPDGEEEEAPHQSATPAATTTLQTNISAQREIRVPTWIEQPPVSTLNVYFKQLALLQLQQLGSEGEQKKVVIRNVLQEDPRSVYLRERRENTSYVFRIAELYVSCKFDDVAHIVTVLQVFKDSVTQAED